MAAVNKAVNLLENLRTQVMAEGEAEAATYNKFACFCQDTTSEKLQTILKSEDEKVDLVSSIGTLVSRRDGLDTKIQMTLVELQSVSQTMRAAALLADALGLGGGSTSVLL